MTRWRALLLLAAAELAGMSVWFGASAAAPALAEQWGFSTADAGPELNPVEFLWGHSKTPQKKGEPSSGRPLRSLGSPLNAQPLGA